MDFLLLLGRGCDFLSDQKVTKESPGPPSMSAMPEAALIGGSPRTPFTGDALLEIGTCVRRAKSGRTVLLAPAHWGLPKLKFAASCVEMTPPTLA